MRAFFCLCLIFASQLTLQAVEKPLREAATDALGKLAAGGIVTAESLQGQVSYSGHAAAGGKDADYTENTLFEIGSITKVFTGLLLAQAVVEGKVTLETPISKLLDSGLTFKDPRVAAITLKQLSTHTSGLPRLAPNHAQGVRGDDPYAGYDEKLLLESLASIELKGTGPYVSSYSNYGVGLLGYLLGRVYGSSWEAAVLSKVCQPLGLQHTRMTEESLHLPLAPPFHAGEKDVSWHFDTMAGAGALRSTAADVLKLGLAIAHPEKTPLAPAFAVALAPQAETSGGHIGLGIFMRQSEGARVYEHNGGTGGYRSSLEVIPAKDIVRVVLINNSAMEASQVIAGVKPNKKRVMPKEGVMAPEALPEYTGVYDLSDQARFTVMVHEKQLWIRLTGQSFLPVFPKAETPDRFFIKVVDAEFQFNREAGKIVSLTLFQNRRELMAKRTDQPVPKITLHTPAELKPYTGTYHLMGLQPFVISLRGNTLLAKLAEQPALPIFDMGKDRFEYDVVEASLTFTRNEEGEILGFTLFQNGIPMPAVRGR